MLGEEEDKYLSLLLLALPKTADWTLTLDLGENFILKPSGETEEMSSYILLSSGVLGQDRFMSVSQGGNDCGFWGHLFFTGQWGQGEKKMGM